MDFVWSSVPVGYSIYMSCLTQFGPHYYLPIGVATTDDIHRQTKTWITCVILDITVKQQQQGFVITTTRVNFL